MEITLNRTTFTDVSTIGELIINNYHVCYTLEDKDRLLTSDMGTEAILAANIYGKTCIPYGRYEVAITYSNHFKKYLPLLMGVSGFDGIRIHSGNTDADTLGCILLGDVVGVDFIGKSRIAFSRVFALLKAAAKKEKVFLNIIKNTVIV